MTDVLVIGAGAVGTSVALALARRGASVRVLEQTAPGAGASSTAAGVLAVQTELHADGPLARLCAASIAMYPRWAADLVAQTGIDVGLRACGGLSVGFTSAAIEAIAIEAAWATPLGFSTEQLDAAAALAIEPALAPDIAGAVRFASDARIDPPSLMKALHVAAERAGARFQLGALVRRVLVEGGRASAVALEDGTRISASAVVVAAGSWSALIGGTGLPASAVRPARGQIVELLAGTPLIRSVVYGPDCYLSPRDDGRVLVGSTMEFVGFRPGVTARAVQGLMAAAIRLVPALGDAGLGRAWSCFRPCSTDELPLLGPTPIGGLFVATGHFRNGIVLSPITGEILGAVVSGEPSPIDLAPFDPSRFGASD